MSDLRDERRKRINDYIESNPHITQIEIVNKINEDASSTTSQSTVVRDLNYLGYKKIGTEYVKSEKHRESEQVSMLKKLFSYDEPIIATSSTKVFQVIISTKKGMEKSIGDLISNIYGNYILGTLIGNGCVMVLTNNEQSAILIGKKLKSYLSETISL